MVHNRNDITLDIIELLIKNDFHIRGIADKLRESHSTVLRKLNKLKKENIVDFRKQGKNKIFFLRKNLFARDYILHSEINKLDKLLKKNKWLEVVFNEVLDKTNSEMVVLFGSYAKESAKSDSDIDIYIETKNKNLKKEIENIHSKINVKIGLFDKNSLLIKEIIKNHVILRGFERFYEEK